MTASCAISARAARLLLLHAQGLFENPAAAVSRDALANLIQRMGYVQIDSINVLERAHHLTLFSRCPEYRPEQLHDLQAVAPRRLFEHWTHDASLVPVEFYPYWHHRFARFKARLRTNTWFQERVGARPRKVLAEVRRRLEDEGPLMSKDFEPPRRQPGVKPAATAWWGWRPHKAALEYLWWTGEVGIVERRNFHKVYDLAERVYPAAAREPRPAKSEFLDWSCRGALERLICATPAQIAKFWGGVELASVRAWCSRAAQRGQIERLTLEPVEGSRPIAVFALNDWRDRLDCAKQAFAAAAKRTRLLSPFDPVIRDRARARTLFNFDYSFEAFVPARKRRFGYYVLPILRGDAFIGRTDLKHDRKNRALVVNGLWFESNLKPAKKIHAELDEALERLAAFIGASRIDRRG